MIGREAGAQRDPGRCLPGALAAWALLAAGPVAAQCLTFGSFTAKGTLPIDLVPPYTATQTSGMAASRHNPGVLWVHDDVSALAQLVAVRTNGALAQQYQITGASNRDWEDMTLGPGPIAGRDYLYITDTGNNSLGYLTFTLIRIAEPDVPSTPGPVASLAAETFRFRYPSGTFNAETLWIDPKDGTPYLLTKENATSCSLFRYPLPLDAANEKTLVFVRRLSGVGREYTGGTLTADGRWILARTTSTIYVWPRPASTAFGDALAASPCTVAAGNQGLAESLAVAPDGRSLWAVSEGRGATLWSAPLGFPAGVPVRFAFGTGLPGASGVPGLGAVQAPRLAGPPLDLGAWQVRPSTAAILLLSTQGFDDGQVKLAGGWLHAAPDVIVPLPIDAAGTGTLGFGVLPDVLALHRLALSGQVLAADSTAVQGLALSAGLRLVLDR